MGKCTLEACVDNEGTDQTALMQCPLTKPFDIVEYIDL